MKKAFLFVAAVLLASFLVVTMARAATVPWDRPAVGRINPLNILDTVFGNIFTATSTTQASTFPYASTTQLTSSGNAYLAVSGGAVGVGTTNAGSLLQVGGSSGSTMLPTAIQLDNTYHSGGPGHNAELKFYLYRNGTETYGFGLNDTAGIEYHAGQFGAGTGHHEFYTDAIERMRITDIGVGIGSTSPGSILSIGNTGWNFIDNGTTTSNAKGIDLRGGGCFAVNGTCITGGGSSYTATWPITLSGSAFGFNGLSTSTAAVQGNIPYFSGVNTFANVATSTLTASSPLTGSFTHIGTTGSLGCQTASGSQAGCLSSADWTTFNNKLSSAVQTLILPQGSFSGNLTVATSTSAFNGLTIADRVVGSGSTLTFTPSLSGTLTVAGGGTGVGTFTSSQLLYGNGTNNLSSVATTTVSCSGTVSCSSFTAIGASPVTLTGSGATFSGTVGQVDYFSGTNTAIGTSTINISTASLTGISSTTPGALLAVGTVGLQGSASLTVASTSVWSGVGGNAITVPAGTLFAQFTLWGGGGAGVGNDTAGGGNNGGGAGAFIATTTVPITAGQTGTIYVGQGGQGTTGGVGYKAGGSGNSNTCQGGGGGGSSAFTASSTSDVIIAAGGGGGGTAAGTGASGTSGGVGGAGTFCGGGGGAAGTAGSNGTNSTGGQAGTGATPTSVFNGSGSTSGGGGSSGGTSGNGTSAASGTGASGSGGAAAQANGTGYESGGGGTRAATGGVGGIPAAGGGSSSNNAPGGSGGNGKVIAYFYSSASGAVTPIQLAAGQLYVSSMSVGIGTTTQAAALAVDNSMGLPLQILAGMVGTVHYVFEKIDQFGHLITGGPAPTVSSCGTSPTIVGNDRNGHITTSGTVTTCTVTFARAYANRVQCIVESGTIGTLAITNSNTGFVATFNPTVGTGGIDYICQGYQ